MNAVEKLEAPLSLEASEEIDDLVDSFETHSLLEERTQAIIGQEVAYVFIHHHLWIDGTLGDMDREYHKFMDEHKPRVIERINELLDDVYRRIKLNGIYKNLRKIAVKFKRTANRGCLWYLEMDPEDGSWTYRESLEFQAMYFVSKVATNLDSAEVDRIGLEYVARVIEEDRCGYLN